MENNRSIAQKLAKQSRSPEKARQDAINARKGRQAYIEACKQQYEEDINVLIHNIEELENYKGKACTVVCEECGTQKKLHNRSAIRKYIKHHREEWNGKILCRGCKISVTKTKKNGERLAASLDNCSFAKDNEYKGAFFEIDKQNRPKYKFTCNICGKYFESPFTFGDEAPVHCPDCYETKTSTSYSEKDLLNFIKTFYKGKIVENSREIISPYELDIYFPELNLAIEFDGEYWHNNSQRTFMKYNLCKEKGIRLVGIYHYEWKNKRSLLENYLKILLWNPSVDIGARECKVKEVPFKEAKDFLNHNHLQGAGTISSKCVNLGLYYRDKLVQLEVFSKPRYSKDYDWELLRECSFEDWLIRGGKAKLLKYFERHYEGSIISYCDKRFFSGISYERCGFKKLEDSNPNYKYVKSEKEYSREKFQKHKLHKLLENFNVNKTETENMLANGYFKLFDFGNMRYIKKELN